MRLVQVQGLQGSDFGSKPIALRSAGWYAHAWLCRMLVSIDLLVKFPGVFTKEWNKAWYAYDQLHVGGVVINDIPSVRVDAQPVCIMRLLFVYPSYLPLQYGGIKSSGVGREGLRYTIEEFTEPKILLTKDLGKL